MQHTKNYALAVMIIYIIVLFADRMDITIVSVALPYFANYFKIKMTETEWISTSFLIALAMFMPVSGWLSEKFGDKKLFIFANIVYLLGGILCFFSTQYATLILARSLQGLGGGFIVPVGMSMVYQSYSPEDYPKVANYTLIPALVAPAIAPYIGGFLTIHYGWRYIFLPNIIIEIFAIAASIIILKPTPVSHKLKLDLPGFITSSFLLISLLYSMSRLGHYGFLDIHYLISFSLFILFSILFVYFEKRSDQPLFDLNFFKIDIFKKSLILQILLQICYFGTLFLLSLYLQDGLQWDPIRTGYVLFIQGVAIMIMLLLSARIMKRFGPKSVIPIGFIGLAVTTYSFVFVNSLKEYYLCAVILFFRGLCIGLINGPLQASAMISFSKKDLGRGAAFFNSVRQAGISFGIAIISLILASGNRVTQEIESLHFLKNSDKGRLYIYHEAFFVVAIFAVLGFFVSMTIDNKKVLKFMEKK